jgi:hypothetical protein
VSKAPVLAWPPQRVAGNSKCVMDSSGPRLVPVISGGGTLKALKEDLLSC